MKKIIFLFCISSLIFFGCNNNLFEETLFRTTEDPFYDVPIVDSFTKERISYVTWQSDDACDCFYLYRAEDQDNLVFECIYKGKSIFFIDEYLPNSDDTRYVYRLDKQRGGKIFKGLEYGYGLSSTVRRDECENNNLEENAICLEYDLKCNIPCIQYITNHKLYLDTDWFYVNVPPHRNAQIIVKQAGISDNAFTDLYFKEKTSKQEKINNNCGIIISNYENETKKIYFSISPDTSKIFSPKSFSCAIEYKIELNQIYKN